MKYDEIYYQIFETNNQPMIDFFDEINEEKYGIDDMELIDDKPLNIKYPIYFITSGEALPKNLSDNDYLSTPDPLFSRRIVEILQMLPLEENVQFLESIIQGEDEDDDTALENRDFLFAHCYTRIRCMHKNRSKFIDDGDGLSYREVTKVSLDENVLDKIDEKYRLVFRFKEAGDFIFYHQKVVDAIMTLKPNGLRMVPVAAWDVGTTFDDT